ncbi:OB-fold protein [Clostridium algidicarnis]|uniref:OB-fold protein n=1 Tax=Clostridium algidicarnis TaxID=37659 RepID=UPI001C0E89B8|nr:hypothetical protein [Clostridium algidicarnis]MBU3226819.1 hypothetical protein [Clostridium algidicarnis]MBU3250270.1 hypothetical protein [Clostridium algidicarnis]
MDKMVKCKACGKEIASGVNKCVHCGKDQRNFFMKHKIITAILVIIVIAGVGGSMSKGGDGTDSKDKTVATNTKKEEKAEKAEKVEKVEVTVTAAELVNAYEENEVKADKDYKDKLASITGKVNSIDVMAGKTFVVLSADKDFSITQVQCFFDDKEEVEKVSELKKGDEVTLEGKIGGKSINVSVDKCKLK